MAKKEFTKTAKSSSGSSFLCGLQLCCRSDTSSRRHTALYDIVASDDSIASDLGDKPETTFLEKVASKFEATKASFRSLFKCCFPTHVKSGSPIEGDSPDEAVSYSSTSTNEPTTISPARAACRREVVEDDTQATEGGFGLGKRALSVASTASLGRRGSDSSSDDEIGVRARGGVVITQACVYRVDGEGCGCPSDLIVTV